MRLRYLQIASLMTLRELFRRKIVIILLILIPSVFYAITYLTTDLFEIPFKIASLSTEPIVMIPARYTALVFMGLASAGLLAAFLAMNLIQRNAAVIRRLIICGYTSSEIAVSKLLVMFAVILLLGFYVGSMLWIFFKPENFILVVLGFIMVGFVYGSYGLLIGSILKGELEGILLYGGSMLILALLIYWLRMRKR